MNEDAEDQQANIVKESFADARAVTPLSINEAKLDLAAKFDVSPEAITISISA